MTAERCLLGSNRALLVSQCPGLYLSSALLASHSIHWEICETDEEFEARLESDSLMAPEWGRGRHICEFPLGPETIFNSG